MYASRLALSVSPFLKFSVSSQVCYARILDLKRKFLEAALRYYDISQIEKRQIGDEYVSCMYFHPLEFS